VARAGDLSPEEAYALLRDDPDAVLVDIRTRAEWYYVGLPDLSGLGKEVVGVEWVTYPDFVPNPHFLTDLEETDVPEDVPVVFLGRMGSRSVAAADAAAAAGYVKAYSVNDGFEGPLDAHSHRGGRAGWKSAGLPWLQS
jgi:rhodanese-related sulfurtransferase